MAMNVLILSVLQQLRPHLPQGASICSLGYPDVMVSEEQARTILGPEVAARLTYRPDSAQIIAWHQLQSKLDRVIDAQSLFDALGLRFTAIDLVASRGCERILDLNQPLTSDLVGAFDVVLDAGTMEHCFNVGQAVRNIIEMAKVGGFVIHQNPMAMVNHGFFNFSPTFYHDFYVQNGHQLISPIYGVSVDGIDVQSHKLHNTGRQDMSLANTMIMCVARKNHDRPPSWPTQTKYLQNPTLKSGSATPEG
jgi:hypothetical protein